MQSIYFTKFLLPYQSSLNFKRLGFVAKCQFVYFGTEVLEEYISSNDRHRLDSICTAVHAFDASQFLLQKYDLHVIAFREDNHWSWYVDDSASNLNITDHLPADFANLSFDSYHDALKDGVSSVASIIRNLYPDSDIFELS